MTESGAQITPPEKDSVSQKGPPVSNKRVITFWVVVTVVILALGVYRLELGRTPQGSDKLTHLGKADCAPKVDIPTGVAVSVGNMTSFNNKEMGGVPVPTSPGSTPAIEFSMASPVEVHIDDKLPPEGAEVPLKGHTIILSKASGNFFMRLVSAGPVLVLKGKAILKVDGPARFGPADDVDYVVKLDTDVKAVVTSGKAMLLGGTILPKVPLTEVQSMVPLQPLRGSIWLVNPIPTLSPLRVAGEPGLADLSVETGRSTLKLGDSLYACALKGSDGGSANWLPAGITPKPVGSKDAGSVSIAVPSDVVPNDTQLLTPIWIALGTTDGQSVATGGVQFVGRLYAAALGTLATLVLLGGVMYATGQKRKRHAKEEPRWFAGLFLGPDGFPSLSLLQIFIWTTITIWGFFYVFIVAGNLLALTPEMLVLLGIAGTGSVIARWITSTKGGVTPQSTGPATSSAASAGAKTAGGMPPKAAVANNPTFNDFMQMLSTNGEFDLLKLQLFAFTLVIGMYVIWRIADAAAFPVLDSNTLLLMGVSQGIYVTGKLAGTSDLTTVQTTKAQLDDNTAVGNDLVAQKADLDAKLKAANTAGNTRDAAALQTQITDLEARIAANKKAGDDLNTTYVAGLAKLGLKPA